MNMPGFTAEASLPKKVNPIVDLEFPTRAQTMKKSCHNVPGSLVRRRRRTYPDVDQSGWCHLFASMSLNMDDENRKESKS
jgi:hypothetical protein